MTRLLLALTCLLLSLACHAETPGFTVVRVDPAALDLRIYLEDERGMAFRRLDRLAEWLQQRKKKLVFGMNAGMYHADATPVGLLVVDGKEIAPLNLAGGSGNFFIKPNGVFFLSDKGAAVVESKNYPAHAAGVRYATQSGPLLLKNGEINAAFNPASNSRLIRNGVCVAAGRVLFVITETPVNLYEFAAFFRDELQCREALYLDGVVSSLYSEEHKRSDHRAALGPLFAVIE